MMMIPSCLGSFRREGPTERSVSYMTKDEIKRGSSLFCMGRDEFKIIRSGIVVTL